MASPILNSRFLPWPIAAALLAVLVLAPGLILTRLNIDNAPEVYLPPQDPTVVFDKELRKTFPRDQILVALFQGDDLLSDHFLSALDQVVEQLTAHPKVERALTVTNLDHVAGTADGFVVETLLGARQIRSMGPQQRATRVADDRFASGLLMADDFGTLALVVRPRELDGSLEALELQQAVEGAVEKAGIASQFSGVAGMVALDVAEFRSMVRDTLIFVPATTGMGLLLIWWLFRRILAVVLSALAINAVVSSTASLLVLADRPFTLMSAIIPPLMAALTVALLVHLFNAILHAGLRGLSARERVARVLREIERPARYTALTTAAGLASLGTSPIPPIMSLGLAAACGALLLYVVVIVLLPPLLIRWDRREWPLTRGGAKWISAMVRGLSRIGMRYPAPILAVFALTLAIGLPQLWRVQAETDLYKFFPADHPITRATRVVEDNLTGVTALEVVFEGTGRDSLKDPQRLRQIKEFQDWAEALPQVDRTASMVDILEELHWAFHGEDPAYRRLPDNRALISQYLLIYDGRDLYDLVDREFQRTRVTLSLHVHGANETSEVIDTISEHLQRMNPDTRWRITGSGRLFADQEDLLIQGQVRSLWVALGVILLFMLILWRSLKDALLCMIPNVSPILLIFIIMGAMGIWLDMATAMIASVAVGIAVDDTIHVYHGYKERLARGASPAFALARSYHQAGRAVVATTFILSAQFLLLTASEFIPTMEFGILTTVGLIAAMLFDLLLLPAILMATVRAR